MVVPIFEAKKIEGENDCEWILKETRCGIFKLRGCYTLKLQVFSKTSNKILRTQKEKRSKLERVTWKF